MKEEKKRCQMDKDEIKQALMPWLELLKRDEIAIESCAYMIATYIIALFDLWKKEQGGQDFE